MSARIGLPAFTNDPPEILATLDIDEENVIGANRDVMLESWFYDTSANAIFVGNSQLRIQIANTACSNTRTIYLVAKVKTKTKCDNHFSGVFLALGKRSNNKQLHNEQQWHIRLLEHTQLR